MRKLILSGVLAAGMMVGAGGSASADDMMMMPSGDVAGACMERTLWSDATCGCVADRAADQLSMGQIALLLTYGDGEFNSLSTARDYDLTLIERWEVQSFASLAAPVCALS